MTDAPRPMTDDELRNFVDHEFANSLGRSGQEIADERAKAWRYYLSKELGNEEEGYSQVVTADVAEVVDSIMPSLLRIFTTADNLAAFNPVGPEDEDAAEQQTDYISHVFFKKNPAFMTLFFWFFDALVQKNGIVKAWWDESERVTQESYKGLSEQELADLSDDEELELKAGTGRLDTVTRIRPTAIGNLPVDVEATVYDVTFERTAMRGQTRVGCVPPENYRISADAATLDGSDARMVGEECEKTRSELVEMGFDKEVIYSLPAVDSTDGESAEKTERRDKAEERDQGTLDKSQEKVRIREAYILVDFDGDGRSELRQVFMAVSGAAGTNTAGNQKARTTLLSNEPVDRRPYHVITPHPLPHKHFGKATAEKVMDLQEINTTLHRQILDNLYHTNNPEHGVWEHGIGENTLDDLMTRRVGGINRFRRPPSESYMPMTVPFTAASTFPMLDRFDKVKRDRTGVSPDSEGLSPDALKNVQISVLANQADKSLMKIEAIARIFAETGIKSLFLHIHELELKHQSREQVVKLRGEWTSVDPREWRERDDMTANIGLGVGTRQQNMLFLEGVRQMQMEMAQGGGLGLTVTPRNIYNTAAEMVKNGLMQPPDRYFKDPGDAQAPPPNAEQQKLAAMQAQLQKQAQDLAEREQRLDFMKLQLQHNKDMQELQIKQDKVQNDLTVALENVAAKLTEIEARTGVDVPGARI